MSPQVRPFFHRDTGSWSYVLHAPGSTAAVVVDPVLDFDAPSGRTATTSAQHLLDWVQQQGLAIEWILETHAHADHLTAAHWLRSETGGRIAIGAGIRQTLKTFRPIFGLGADAPEDGSQFDRLLEDGDRIEVDALSIETIATPGHTADGCSFLAGDALFVGDTLFMPDIGTARCDFPGGDAATLYRSLRRLLALPPATRVFACHDYPPAGREPRYESSVEEQRRDNIHVRDGVAADAFVAMRSARDATLPMPTLLLAALQVNLRAGALPVPDDTGVRYLKLPLNQF